MSLLPRIALTVAAVLVAAPAYAQDAPDLGRLAELIRWGGVVASVPVIFAALFLIRVVEGFGNRLSVRFSNRRPTIQKVQTTIRFFVYVAATIIAATLSIRLDATALTVIGGALAFAVGFALRDLVASPSSPASPSCSTVHFRWATACRTAARTATSSRSACAACA